MTNHSTWLLPIMHYYNFYLIGDCPVGQYYNDSNSRCEDCQRHYYQDMTGQDYCLPCRLGRKTSSKGSNSSSSCYGIYSEFFWYYKNKIDLRGLTEAKPRLTMYFKGLQYLHHPLKYILFILLYWMVPSVILSANNLLPFWICFNKILFL